MSQRLFWLMAVLILLHATGAPAEIPKPADAPRPLAAEESAKHFQVPAGFKIELVASEPLIREPSGVCWDARGRMFVCELHGYNLEGQLDIEELNKTGQLDHVVRRLDANPAAKRAAAAGTFGTVKLLSDTDGDGRMDKQTTWADKLPPCYGICPARDGIIVACAPHIMFLADRDGDGRAEIREELYTGFAAGNLERGINNPQWGLDDWIYLGSGHGGAKITGPHLPAAVELPGTNFRIKADGSAIEPVIGATHTIGIAQTERGDHLVTNTNGPGLQVAPLPWRYLARNRDVAVPALEQQIGGDNRTYPTSKPHPWRTQRASDPGFAKYYTDRYGVSESAPNGYFTSACSPLVYQDQALPGLSGQLLTCEPAQNLVHREIVSREGVQLKLRRPAGEERAEFLTSTDVWFHPIALTHAPDGNIYIADFYREIIEDYSAIPRYLQQQYELNHGQDHGRIWRLTHQDAPAAAPADMSHLTPQQLVGELASKNFWRRQTARRLLGEQKPAGAAPLVAGLIHNDSAPATVLGALYTLDAMGSLAPQQVLVALSHVDAGVRVHGLRLAQRWLDSHDDVSARVLSLVDDQDDGVALQLALSLGDSTEERAIEALVKLALQRGDAVWMDVALLSSLSGRGDAMLDALLTQSEALGKAGRLVKPLAAMIGASRSQPAMSRAIVSLSQTSDRGAQLAGLQGLRSAFAMPTRISLHDSSAGPLASFVASGDAQIAAEAKALVRLWKIESDAARAKRIAKSIREMSDIQIAVEARLAAVADLAGENDQQVTTALIEAVEGATPQVREALLGAIFSRRDRLAAVAEAIVAKRLPVPVVSAAQRTLLLENVNAKTRKRLTPLVESAGQLDPQLVARYAEALGNRRDPDRGEKLFREKCGVCHQAHGIGVAVGPNLDAEFQRAEETILRDILAPSSAITAGFNSYTIVTTEGQVYSGLLAAESANSVTLRQQEGKTQDVLRKNIEVLKANAVSLMPEDLTKTVGPQDVADILSWLRSPPIKAVLIDEDATIVSALNEGDGTVALVNSDAERGQFALLVTPLQRSSARVKGWKFAIREQPAAGEFRYLRFAWKSTGATGVMIELADGGKWPSPTSPERRFVAGKNTTSWQAVSVSDEVPSEWTVVVRDLWKEFGDMTLTGIAPTACGGPALFDAVDLLREAPK